MPLIGVRPEGRSSVVLVEAKVAGLEPGMWVDCLLEGKPATCTVVVGPADVIATATAPIGQVTAVLPASSGSETVAAVSALERHPAVTMPYLGQVVSTPHGRGRVIGLDVPNALCTIELSAGDRVIVSTLACEF